MLVIRSLTYNLLFYLVTASIVILGLPLLLAPRQWTMDGVYKMVGRANLWLLKHVCGIEHEIRGRENLPEGPFIVAAKHQSVWETFALAPFLRYPIVIFKHELTWIPILGTYIKKFGFIPVRRSKGRKASKQLVRDTQRRMNCTKCELLIFPEGTRRSPGAPPQYKQGVYRMYAALNIPVVPVALNSGMHWPRRKFLRYPGKVVAEFLPPIPPHLEKDEFMKQLATRIEHKSLALAFESLQNYPQTPIPPELATHFPSSPASSANTHWKSPQKP